MSKNQFLRPGGATSGKLKQMQEATNMENFVREKAQRTGSQAPPYRLLELIGKGSFGRVYKSQRHGEKLVVAVKIMDIDSSDYNLRPAEKDQAIKDFITEISILRTLTDAKAKNINTFFDAFSFHSQLWIVSEYCPGGSVHTLMKASPKPGLEEKYIVAISREVALALTYIHKAGIIHRDVKAANILVTEDGLVQLCDFGVSGILESSAAKRSTIIGTPFWMAPELHSDAQQSYSTEVDCWALGCTIYEMATGLPPNARVNPNMLHMALQTAPRLEGDQHSAALREFVSFCLQEQPERRPSAKHTLEHSFLHNTSKKFPTHMLRQLIERFTPWEHSGGQRASLFNPYGAAAPMALHPISGGEDEWNFSTTDEFDLDMLSDYSNTMEPLSKTTSLGDRGSVRTRSSTIRSTTPYDQAREEQRVLRGGRKIGRIFDQTAEPYEYSQGEEDGDSWDLPLRMLSNHSANRETIIDLDFADDLVDVPSMDTLDLPTIKAQKPNRFYEDDDEEIDTQEHDLTSKRLTREWKYPESPSKRLTRDWKYPESLTLPAQDNVRRKTQDWTMAVAVQESETAKQEADDSRFPPSAGNVVQGFRPTLKHTVTEPLGSFGDFLHPAPHVTARLSLSLEPPDRASMIDIDPAYISRPSTAASSTGESAMTDFTTGDPFELEESFNTAKVPQRTSFHAHSQSEPTPADRNSNPSVFNSYRYRGDGSFSSDSEYERNRPMSVQASVDSLRQVVAAEEYWDRDFLPSLHSRLASAGNQQPQPLLSAPEGPTYERDIWNNYDPELTTTPTMNAGGPHLTAPDDSKPSTIDGVKPVETRFRSEGRGRVPPPFTDQRNLSTAPPPVLPPLPPTQPLTQPPALHTPTNSQSHSHSHHTSVFSHTSSGSIAPSLNISSSPEQSATGGTAFSDTFHLGHGHGLGLELGLGTVSFPEPAGPDAAALEEDADPEVVVGEVERLLEDFLVGLRVAGGLVGEGGWVVGQPGDVVGGVA